MKRKKWGTAIIGDVLGTKRIIDKRNYSINGISKGYRYTAECISCGKITENDLCGIRKSQCKCIAHKFRLKIKGDVKASKRINPIKAQAKKRKLDFSLDYDRCSVLMYGDCFYCGKKPIDAEPLNGIDRIDSSKGYIEGNVVSCCTQCNLAKLDYSQQEFIEWAKKLYKNLIFKGL